MQNNSTYIAALIKRQWIRDEYVASDLFTLDVIDADFTGGYKPMILTMESLRDILIESISFIDLPDTPSTYAGASGQVPIVNSAEDALEFVDYIDTFLELTDTPIDYVGMAGYGVFVNSAEGGLEFVAPVVEEEHYEARVSFTPSLNPSVNQLLANNLGVNVVWTRTALGVFQANFVGPGYPLDDTKITAYIGNSSSGTFVIGAYNVGYIQFIHTNFSGVISDPTSIIPVEIKLYP
jgi:hypothetical protein